MIPTVMCLSLCHTSRYYRHVVISMVTYQVHACFVYEYNLCMCVYTNNIWVKYMYLFEALCSSLSTFFCLHPLLPTPPSLPPSLPSLPLFLSPPSHSLTLFQHSMRPTKDYNGCSVLRRYFAQLHLLRARFPPETLGQIPVDFAW